MTFSRRSSLSLLCLFAFGCGGNVDLGGLPDGEATTGSSDATSGGASAGVTGGASSVGAGGEVVASTSATGMSSVAMSSAASGGGGQQESSAAGSGSGGRGGGGGGGGGGSGGGGAGPTFTIGGSVMGLNGTLVLQNAGGDDLSVTQDGSFDFATPLSKGAPYKVTVKTQPLGEKCKVSGGSGIVAGDVSDVAVDCAPRRIVFSSTMNLSGNPDDPINTASNIWVVNVDGTGLTPLTNTTLGSCYWPHWSPDGSKIMFASYLNGNTSTAISNFNVWVVNADGTGLTPLTTSPTPEDYGFEGQWSPDGSKIVFEIGNLSVTPIPGNIAVMNADGTGVGQLTKTTEKSGFSARSTVPQWSPDGSQVVFQSFMNLAGDPNGGTGGNNIWKVNADGTGLVPLTKRTSGDSEDWTLPQWSPDGSKIVFQSHIDPSKGVADPSSIAGNNIWVMNADGTQLTPVTNSASSNNIHPQWSPDGSKIVFSSQSNLEDPAASVLASPNVWVVNADGTGLLPLTHAHAPVMVTPGTTPVIPASYWPQWSPDGSEIVFQSQLSLSKAPDDPGSRAANIWVMKADGTELTPLTAVTAIGGDSRDAQWSP